MIRVKNGVQLWLEFEEKNGREPTREEVKNMGFSPDYFYKLRKKIDIIKAQNKELWENSNDNSQELWNRR